MKGFLFDESVPQKGLFLPSLPVMHAANLGCGISDSKIWSHAKSQSLVIVTKDSDFSNRMMISTPPPWVEHLRFGNFRRHDYHEFFAKVWPQVEKLLPAHKLINVYLDRIEAVA